MPGTFAGSSTMRQILGAIRTSTAPVEVEAPRATVPFVTLSRQAGTDARNLAHRLVERLNQRDPGGRPWASFDRELVEKVAADHNLARELVESLEDRAHNWLEEVFSGLTLSGGAVASETKVYRSVAETIRALAQVGRVVVVGRGGAYITHRMPGGVHIHLVAPLAYRVADYARRCNLPEAEAERKVRQIEQNREAFYRRYWADRTTGDDVYTLTLNMAKVSDDEAVEVILPLIKFT